MTVWILAGLLGVATGLRIGWALVNKQSIVSTAMMLALGSLSVVAALNWPPLTLLIDTVLRWPNVAVALSQAALALCAAASCVMVTTAASTKKPVVTKRLAIAHYTLAAILAATSLAIFFGSGRQDEMAPQEFLRRYLQSNTALPWLLPLLYVVFASTVVMWVGMRYSSRSRRGRALFVFTVGIGMIVLGSGFFLLRALSSSEFVSIGAAVTLLACAMLVVAAGSLLPSVEDYFGAQRELKIIGPLLDELLERQPVVGVGVRPRGPLGFQVAERMSLISDALFLEATKAARETGAMTDLGSGSKRLDIEDLEDVIADSDAPRVEPKLQAEAIARWLHGGVDGVRSVNSFPGLNWMRQPDEYSDREWILEISRQYRNLGRDLRQTGRNDELRARRTVA